MRGIGIIGLGLIGGSLAKAIRRNMDRLGYDSLFGYDLNDEVMSMALSERVIEGNTMENLPDCELVIIALTPNAAISWAEENAPGLSGKTVIDICGVKTAIYNRIQPLAKEYGFTYLGTHPMAGKEVSGYFNSDADLFKNASMILTPDGDTPKEVVSSMSELFSDIGFGRITLSTVKEHDDVIAYTSQLAHVASNGFIKSETAQKFRGFSAGSFKDLTRVAKLDENMWTELFSYNKEPLTRELKTLIANLGEYLTALESDDYTRLKELLREGRILKEKSINSERE